MKETDTSKYPVVIKTVLVDGYGQRVSAHAGLHKFFAARGQLLVSSTVNKSLNVNLNDGFNTKINILSCTSGQYKDMSRGNEISEVLVASNIKQDVLDEVEDFMYPRIRVENRYLNVSLYVQLSGLFSGNLYDKRYELNILERFKNYSYSEEFNFPASLFRATMVDLFEIRDKPTREEFLMAIMTEGISAKTPEEVNAISEAQVYIQNKGNDTDKGKA